MVDISMKTLAVVWADALQTGKEPLILDLSELVFGLSASEVRLDKLGNDKDKDGLDIDTKKAKCLTLLTQSLLQNGLESLEELEATPSKLVSGVYKIPFLGCYLPLSTVGFLISVKKYLSLARVYPAPPPVVGVLRVMLEGYLSSWTSAKHMGIPTYEEKITFDGASESWNFFRIDMTGIRIKHGILRFLSFASVGC